MGNRANVIFKQDGGYLGLYLHNASGNHEQDVARAIQRVIDAGRTHDISYATRIAVSEIIGKYWSQDLSYGLYVGTTIDEAIGDNENDIIVIDFIGNVVTVYGYTRKNYMVVTTNIKEQLGLCEYINKYLM